MTSVKDRFVPSFLFAFLKLVSSSVGSKKAVEVPRPHTDKKTTRGRRGLFFSIEEVLSRSFLDIFLPCLVAQDWATCLLLNHHLDKFKS